MRRIIVILLVVVAAGVIVWRVREGRSAEPTSYRLVEITKGDLSSVVAATGTLNPVTTVQVGTQVSGIIESVNVDFNDHVTAGQVIARIDTTLLAAAVASSKAQVERADAEQRQAEREFTRLSALHQESMISDSEFNTAQYNLDVSRAGVKAARVDLDRAERNLTFATIKSPIDGIVVQRSIDPGQTVQASFSAPELFRIAGDLTAMQILASVDESDIGQIKEGQAVKFTVQAMPNDSFTGTVRQVRLQSVIQENVVNYIAVVDVPNSDRRLLPGMTASVEFIVDQVKDVFQVPNAALRYRPDQAIMAAVLEKKRAERAGGAGADSARAGRPGGQGGEHGGGMAGAGGGQGGERHGGAPGGFGGGGMPGAAGGMPANRGMLWFTGESGKLDVMFVRTGITDGTNTEIRGRDLTVGTKVIAGVTSAATTTTSSPFQAPQQPAGPMRPGGF